MKKCPVCKTTYTDDTLQFCLADGATLSFSTSEQPTEQFSGGTNPIRVNITKDETPTIVAKSVPTTTEPEIKKGRGWNLVFGLIIGFVLSAILAAIMFAGIIWWQKRGNDEAGLKTKPTPTAANSPNQTPTANNETENLKEKIANLEKQMQEQKKKNQTVPTINNPTTTDTPQSKKVIARVNSPGDGFLALRTQPSAEVGERILQIPHGANVTVYACLPKAAGKKGRWCRVDYNGNAGWAYDGFLIY